MYTQPDGGPEHPVPSVGGNAGHTFISPQSWQQWSPSVTTHAPFVQVARFPQPSPPYLQASASSVHGSPEAGGELGQSGLAPPAPPEPPLLASWT
jgi:hypothetical protein